MEKPAKVEDYFKIIGCEVKDKVTHVKGIATTVSFDLYGCVQVIVTPKVDKDNKQKESYYFDYHRLEVIDRKPVMPLPKFTAEEKKAALVGPSVKPHRSNIVKR